MPPQYNQSVKQIDPFTSPGPPAGVTSARLTKIVRCDLDDTKGADSTYAPRKGTDPITHRVLQPDDSAFEAHGAAGLRTQRITQLTTNSVEMAKSRSSFKPPARTNPIAHVGGAPDPPKGGIRQFTHLSGKSDVRLDHSYQYCALSPDQIKADPHLKRKEVYIGGGNAVNGGDYLYNVGGFGDLLPAATKPCLKTDIVTSQAHRIENDKRDLPKFISMRVPLRAQHPYNDESAEMRGLMWGRGH